MKERPPAVLTDAMLVLECSAQHKLGSSSNYLASPALSALSDVAGPEARCPNSTLAPGEVEAEGTLAKSTSTVPPPRLFKVTPRDPPHF